MHAYVGRLAINAARRGGSHYHWLSPVMRAPYIPFPMLAMLYPMGPLLGPPGGRPLAAVQAGCVLRYAL